MEDYNSWIMVHYPTSLSARLKCAEATLAMSLEFPELLRVRGLASVEEPYGLPPTRTPHWWLETFDGEVIDPTAHQYPTRVLQYEAVDEERGGPTGKCPNCGGLCYNQEYCCTDRCFREYLAYLNN